MHRPPLDPREKPLIEHPTWQGILVSYAMVAGVFLVMWAISYPVAGVVVFGSLGGLVFGGRRAVRLVRCFSDCGGFAFELGERVRITVTQPRTEDCC